MSIFETWLEDEADFKFCSISIRELNVKWSQFERYKNTYNGYCKKDKIDYNLLVDKLTTNTISNYLELSLMENSKVKAEEKTKTEKD